jgi:1-pyrroline-5-carboxylate dehydrogenase
MAVRLTYTSGAIDAQLDGEFEARLTAARDAEAPLLAHMVAGEAVAEGEVFERRDPANLDVVASRAHEATAAVVERAVVAAREAATPWRRAGWEDRVLRLRRVADAIEDRHIEMAAVVSLETGKTRIEAILEVQEGIELVRAYTGHMADNDGYTEPLASYVEGESNTETLRPFGVFAVVSPFNFPFALTLGMTVAALVAGNTVVLKPSEDVPWTGALFAEALEAAELPAGAFNLVHGGADAGRLLIDADVDGAAFTGSAKVGREIVAKMHSGPYARPALTELGGKNPAIVTASADVAKAAEGVARAAYGLSGQKCSACSRAIVVDAVHDEFVEALAEVTRRIGVVGDPLAGDSFVGPVINERAVARYEGAVAAAKRDGRIVAGGGRPERNGHYVEPTVVADLPHGHPLTREELFLPFVTVTRVASFEDALAEANAVDYGLTAGLFSTDQDEIDEYLDRIEAGIVYVNRGAGATTGAWPGTQTFCGWKSSGTTGKGGLGPYYVPQFLREQSRTIVA